MINGITVPPEPAPSVNNATLAGVDINNNGVRDDVERHIARRASNQVAAAAALSYARAYEKMYRESWAARPRSEALALQKALLCTDFESADAFLYGTASGSIHAAAMNTPQRQSGMTSYTTKLGSFSSSEVTCD